ncbi:MAG TPA: alpha/beta fold hydrolase [Candidatus Paceibacterota bacterium]|nr:alpha/beta fold hydrolase [Candidatus Paceibacterota bacterium]
MTPAYVVQITTPKHYILNGLWFGPKKPKRAIIFIHGLTASAFSMSRLIKELVGPETAVITFNNRGFEQVGEVKRKRRGETQWIRSGAGHEVFTESADDVQGAINLVKRAKVKEIYLAGHSTGAQKAYYWAYKNRREKGVKGIFLLGPLSDYACAVEEDRNGRLKRSVAYARKLVRSGKPHGLMPKELGPWFVCDAQRFLSLYTPNSVEEIFTYIQPNKISRIVRSVTTPTAVFLAGAEEHTKRPAREIAAWFQKHLKPEDEVVIIPRVGHSFRGGEKKIAKVVRGFMKEG